MRWLVRHAKLNLAKLLHRTGALNVLVDRRLKNRIPVLMYHRVIDDVHAALTDSSPGIIVRDGSFEMQMRTLREEFNPISLGELQESLDSDTKLPPRSCLVTFDDGWLDNFEIAWPILRKYSIPAVVFLPCNFVSGESVFWQEEILMHLTAFLRSGDPGDTEVLASLLESDAAAHSLSIEGIRDFVLAQKIRPQNEIEDLLVKIRGLSSTDRVSGHYNRYISWDQAIEMQAGGITFASHAVTHRVLTKLTPNESNRELVDSKRILTERLNTEVQAVAYPNGDFDERVISQAYATGYRIGFTTRAGLFSPSADNALEIPRINLHDRNSRSKALFLCTCIKLL